MIKGKKYVKPQTEVVATISLAELMITIGGGSTDMNLAREENSYGDSLWLEDEDDESSGGGGFWED